MLIINKNAIIKNVQKTVQITFNILTEEWYHPCARLMTLSEYIYLEREQIEVNVGCVDVDVLFNLNGDFNPCFIVHFFYRSRKENNDL